MADDLERLLRSTLHERAEHAPHDDFLPERIIATTARDHRPRSLWRTWALPLAAAGGVAAVIASVVLASSGMRHETAPPAATRSSHQPTPSQSPSAPSTPSPTAGETTGGGRSTAADITTLHNVQILDLTFAGTDDGWALSSADCVIGSGRCTALLRTTDGRTWSSIPGPAFNVPGVNSCAAPCVTNLRFADDQIGYAFGPSAFFMTRNGGHTWTQQKGGAIQLETFNGNVIRVTSAHTGCPSWCDVGVETAAIGSATWAPAKLPAGTPGDGVQLVRGGHDAYLLFVGRTAGGASTATSVLYRSTDDGRTWQRSGEPCPQTNGEVDSHAIAAGGADRVSVLCATRQAPQQWFVAVSSDAGAHFTSRPGVVPAETTELLSGDPATVLAAGGDGLVRSTDGGVSWQPVPTVTGKITFLGFQTTAVGRLVTDQRTIWTTRDGGQSWTH